MMVFLTFLNFFLKFREQIPCREAASNALRLFSRQNYSSSLGDLSALF
jgi:hypothetical protein